MKLLKMVIVLTTALHQHFLALLDYKGMVLDHRLYHGLGSEASKQCAHRVQMFAKGKGKLVLQTHM